MESPVQKSPSPENVADTSDEHVTLTSEKSDEDEESDDDSTLFEKRVSFAISDGNDNEFKSVGMGLLRIAYDDEVFGYHVYMTSDNGDVLCEHIIAVQTRLRTEKKKASWNAIDLSLDPPIRRRFRATFSSIDALKEFTSIFEEGKEAAIHSEIVERTYYINSSESPAQKNVVDTSNEHKVLPSKTNDENEENVDGSTLFEKRVSDGNDDEFKGKEAAVYSKIVERADYFNSSDVRKLQSDLEFLLEGNFSDVVVKVGDEEFKCHRCILASRSPVFLAMLTHDTTENATGVIEIKDADPNIFSDFLRYVYTGNVKNLNMEKVLDLYMLSDKYHFIELKNGCVKYMLENISLQNFCDIVATSLFHNEKEVNVACIKFFKENWNSLEIIKTCKWQTFLSENPIACNELLIKVLECKKDEHIAGKL